MNGLNNGSPPGLEKLLFAMVRGGAVSVELFLHRGFGLRYVTQYGLMGVGLMMFYLAWWPPEEFGPFVVYFLLFVALCLLRILGAWIRFWRGDSEHTLYGGFPVLLRRRLAHREYKVKQFFEPLLVAIVGAYTIQWDRVLGIYWIGAGVCLFISNAWERRWLNWQALALHDATLEQQHSFRRFQEIHGVRN